MKFSNVHVSFVSVVALSTIASASAWSCGPSQRVIGNPYSVGYCRPNESCGPSAVDLLSLPEIQAMLRRGRNKQRYFYRPFLDEFRYSMDRPFGSSTFPPWKTRSDKKSTPTPTSPRYDITETDSNIRIDVDVPGIEMSNISILLDDQTKVLTISGSREQTTNSYADVDERDDSTGWSKSTRSFSQKFLLRNPTIDINDISASLENGVLTITLPKIPPKEVVKEINVRQIPIMNTKSATATTVNESSNVNAESDAKTTDTESSGTDSVVAMSENEGKQTDEKLDDDATDDSQPNTDNNRKDDE